MKFIYLALIILSGHFAASADLPVTDGERVMILNANIEIGDKIRKNILDKYLPILTASTDENMDPSVAYQLNKDIVQILTEAGNNQYAKKEKVLSAFDSDEDRQTEIKRLFHDFETEIYGKLVEIKTSSKPKDVLAALKAWDINNSSWGSTATAMRNEIRMSLGKPQPASTLLNFDKGQQAGSIKSSGKQ